MGSSIKVALCKVLGINETFYIEKGVKIKFLERVKMARSASSGREEGNN